MNNRRFALIVISAVSLLVLIAPSAFAQGFVDEPPRPGQIQAISGPIHIELHSVDAVVDGPVANVKVTQVFRNQSDWQVEGVYIFPLPPGSAVSDFQMTVDGEVLEGEVLSQDEARRIYETIVRQRRDPALLEYIGQDLFQTSVFPIPAMASRKLELTYSQVLPLDQGLYRFHYPLQTRQYTTAPVGTLAFRVELRNQPGLRTIYSPSHDVSIDRTADDAALIGFEDENIQPEQDFDLLFGVSEEAIGLNLISHKPAGEDGFFLLLAAPSIEVAPDEIVERDIVLVLDVSGSMEGAKLQQAKEAAHYLVEHLNPGDRFNIISFSTGARLWSERLKTLRDADAQSVHNNIDNFTASGSTDINRALLEAIGQLHDSDADEKRPAYLLFMTDGLASQGVTESERIVANALDNLPPEHNVRFFAFGVGYDVDTNLLDTLSAELGGRTTYVKPDERIDEAISSFYEQISTPVLTDVKIDFAGMLIDDTYPYPLPDLFAGEQLVLVGRYREGGDTSLELSGVVNGKQQVFTYTDKRLVEAGGEPLVARLWATRKIGTILQQIRRGGSDDELIKSVIDLSTRYGIVTPYTSYLVLEPQFRDRFLSSSDKSMQSPMVQRLESRAQAAQSLERMAEMETSGADAVQASEERTFMLSANRAMVSRGSRYVDGKSFRFQQPVQSADGQAHELWVDSQYRPEMPLQTVVFGSDVYFELAERDEVAAWLTVSPELIVVIDEIAYRITLDSTIDHEVPSSAPQAPDSESIRSDVLPNPLETFRNWLDKLLSVE